MGKLYLFVCCLQLSFSYSQQESIQWWNPAEHDCHVIEGQAWPDELQSPYDRLPAKAEKTVREAVWNLSRHASGLKIRFRSNSEEIIVRYTVAHRKAMEHMPATGVSGVDLYAKDSDGRLLWCNGRREFSDTITYRFAGLQANDKYHEFGREYRLNLPLYNKVDWLEIGVPEGTFFEALAVRKEKPIVIYGTSIAHGACASRPGMAWTNILSRKMDRPLINLAFSGNGRLENELIDLLLEIDAKVYVLDCLPNLWREEVYDDTELEGRILKSVRQLRKERPETPILLTDHAGYTDGFINSQRMEYYTRVNKIQKIAFEKLKKEGIKGIYALTYDEIGMQLDDMVDGTHPNDLGMARYADAYEKKLREILNEPIGSVSTARPVTQYREPGNYDWEHRHREILEMNQIKPPKKVILANSIIHFWGGEPESNIVREANSWERHFTPGGLRNYAYGWDRIENVLWRVYHGELDGFEAEQILVMIGTNNLHLNTDEEILAGLGLLMRAIRSRQPKAELVWLGLLPRRGQENRIMVLNALIKDLAEEFGMDYAYLGDVLVKGDGNIDESLFSDGLHPNKEGYLKMGEVLLPLITD